MAWPARRLLGAGGHDAGGRGCRGGRCLSPLRLGSPGYHPVRAGRRAGATTGRETAVDTALSLLREAVAAGAGAFPSARWVAVGGVYARTFGEGVRKLELHPVGRLRKDAIRCFPYTGPHCRRPLRPPQPVAHGQHDAGGREGRLVPPAARTDPQMTEGVLLYSTDTDLSLERIFRFYGTRFQIEFAFRDAKLHLGLNDCQTRSQAQLHFHFNRLRRPLLDSPAGPALAGC